MSSTLLKFRLWDIWYNQMISWNDIYALNPYDLTDALLNNTSRYIVMQWSGLQDMHGTDIYTGDVVNLNYEKSEVVFENGAFCYESSIDGKLYPLYELDLTDVEILEDIYSRNYNAV